MNLDMNRHQYAMLYEIYANFQNAYYGKDARTVSTKQDFLAHAPLIIIDCSKEKESHKQAPVDVRAKDVDPYSTEVG